jgi:CRP-like cAMP-binding protein
VPPPLTHTLVRALQGVPAFASLDEDMLLRVVGASANLFWPAGAPVFEAGDRADALYVVLSGSVRIEQPDGEEPREVARMEPGDFFGELALLLEKRRSKRAVAAEDSELMVLSREPLCELLDASPDVAAHVRRTMEERLASP